MKKIALLCFILGLLIPGCIQDTESILKTTNALYLDIKTVVTDPEIQPLISDETMDRLAGVELVYLGAVQKLKETENPDTLPMIADCADQILDIINSLVLDEKYQKKISAIRISIKILRNHI